jgi:phage shock protein PspC (stress-responsive transcriptional regulator)
MSDTKLRRSETDKMIAGVCGGVAAYLGIDSVFVRLLFVFLLFASGIALPLYLILWLVMPRETEAEVNGTAVWQSNMDEIGQTVSKGANRLGKPATVGLVFILLGAYFLLTQTGLAANLGGLAFPLFIVGFGLYFLLKQHQ